MGLTRPTAGLTRRLASALGALKRLPGPCCPPPALRCCGCCPRCRYRTVPASAVPLDLADALAPLASSVVPLLRDLLTDVSPIPANFSTIPASQLTPRESPSHSPACPAPKMWPSRHVLSSTSCPEPTLLFAWDLLPWPVPPSCCRPMWTGPSSSALPLPLHIPECVGETRRLTAREAYVAIPV